MRRVRTTPGAISCCWCDTAATGLAGWKGRLPDRGFQHLAEHHDFLVHRVPRWRFAGFGLEGFRPVNAVFLGEA
jgi:hypothetical protein